MSGIIQYLSFCDWLISLGTMISRFIPVVVCLGISFLSKAEYYSIVCLYHILFIHSSVNGRVSVFHLLAIVNSDATNTGYKYLFKTLLLIVLDIYPEVELLDYMKILFLIF